MPSSPHPLLPHLPSFCKGTSNFTLPKGDRWSCFFITRVTTWWKNTWKNCCWSWNFDLQSELCLQKNGNSSKIGKYPRYAEEFLEICPFWEAEENHPNYPTTFCKRRKVWGRKYGVAKERETIRTTETMHPCKDWNFWTICHTIWSSWIQSRNAWLCFFPKTVNPSQIIYSTCHGEKRKETLRCRISRRLHKKNGIFQEVRGWKHGGNMHAVPTNVRCQMPLGIFVAYK